MEKYDLKQVLKNLIYKGKSIGYTKDDYYYINNVINYITISNDNIIPESKDIIKELESIKSIIFNAGLLNKFSNNNVNYIKDNSRILPLVLANTDKKFRICSNYSFMFTCMFHDDSTPSLSVSDSKNLFHCFGCNIKGSVINYLSKIENISFTESIELLSRIFLISKKIQSKNDELVKKYKKVIFSDKYLEIIELSKDKMLDFVTKNDIIDKDTNKIITKEDVLLNYKKRLENIKRIKNGVYDSNFKYEKVLNKYKIK